MERADLVICQQIVGGRDGVDDLRLARAAGFGSVSLHTSRLAGRTSVGWRVLVTELGLEVSGFMALRDILGGTPDAADTITRAATVGASYVLVTTGPLRDRAADEADAVCARWFATTQPIATSAGVRLALEPMHPLLSGKSYVHTLRHAHRLVRDVPGAAVVADTGHLWWDERFVEDFVTAADAVVSVQLADVNRELLAANRYDRVPFGAGVVPNDSLVQAFASCGYGGPYEIETPRHTGTTAREMR